MSTTTTPTPTTTPSPTNNNNAVYDYDGYESRLEDILDQFGYDQLPCRPPHSIDRKEWLYPSTISWDRCTIVLSLYPNPTLVPKPSTRTKGKHEIRLDMTRMILKQLCGKKISKAWLDSLVNFWQSLPVSIAEALMIRPDAKIDDITRGKMINLHHHPTRLLSNLSEAAQEELDKASLSQSIANLYKTVHQIHSTMCDQLLPLVDVWKLQVHEYEQIHKRRRI